MNQDILTKLAQEFPKTRIKSRRGSGGKNFDYVEAHTVIAKLNEAIDGDWSFEIVDHKILDNEVVVLGKLIVHKEPQISKSAFGSQAIKRYDQSGEIICLGDDLKAAASDALKKAATLLGVALHLYDKDSVNGSEANAAARPNGSNGNDGNASRQAANSQSVNGNGANSQGNGHGSPIVIRDPNAPLTVNQLKAIFKICKSTMGMTNQAINEMVKERFGKENVDSLTKQEASDLIDSMKTQ